MPPCRACREPRPAWRRPSPARRARSGQTLGVAVVGSLVSASLQKGNHLDFAVASRAGWWVLAGCGAVVLVLGLVATTPWARVTAHRTAEAINPEYLEEHAA